MADTIQKNMEIRLTGSDETGSAWDSFKTNIDAAKEWITPLNQAWELSAKLWGKISDAAAGAIDVLSRGGQFNETATAFERLSASTGRDGDAMVRHLQEITNGVMGLEDAMNLASRQMQAGFSDKEANAIASFAKKVEEATGDSMESTIEQIERAIRTGQRLERLEMFGLHIEKGMQMNQVVQELDKATKRFGDGAFNFGDLWKGAWQKVGDVVLIVGRELNNLMGKDGSVESGFKRFMAGIDDVITKAPVIATALWTPVRQVVQWLDIITEGTEGAGDVAVEAIYRVGNGLYFMLEQTAKFAELPFKMIMKVAEADKAVSDFFGNAKNSAVDEEFIALMSQYTQYSERIADSRERFNEALFDSYDKTKTFNREQAAAAPISSPGFQPPSKYNLWTPGQMTRGDTGISGKKPLYEAAPEPMQEKPAATASGSGSIKVELVAPPGDSLFQAFISYINQAIQKEGAVGAGI